MSDGLVVGVVVAAVCLAVTTVAFVWLRRIVARKHREIEPTPVEPGPDGVGPAGAENLRALRKKTADFGIRYDELVLGKLLGKGSQGEVFRGMWRGSPVAIKKIDTRKVCPACPACFPVLHGVVR